ncbi:hypothetical protein [Sporomusa acidovorans]|uniref:Flagellar protein FliT n=1 Tax=Sporomusa acidovorans (strain ATCC 49682 / DSM 3132 / Mol) TaxID=1123286 RepID=A0ABZ3J6Q5_SPOA4|nr:hypothetical protein [Sporomusa acidovorans]OZC19418.1 hypothetical protein SPACI_30080 [Sporomusa acidovorans DSM 3132]SDD77042.1 hypothetical protein SAMN04488499_10048 [Sporomusa acidovorans]
MSNQELQQKWQDYLFLTREMNKFLLLNDLDLFHSLVDQRGDLQQQIETMPDEAYYNSDDGKMLLQVIKKTNAAMLQNFHKVFNSMKQRENVAKHYESKINFVGNYLNSST